MGRVKVVLTEALPKVGDVGEIVAVAGGFARNYLVPRGLAVPATKGNVKRAEDWKQEVAARVERERVGAEEAQRRLQSAPLSVTARAGPDGRLFGSITNADIAAAIAKTHDMQIERHAIELDEPIRHLGFHEVSIRLHRDITARVTVEAVEA